MVLNCLSGVLTHCPTHKLSASISLHGLFGLDPRLPVFLKPSGTSHLVCRDGHSSRQAAEEGFIECPERRSLHSQSLHRLSFLSTPTIIIGVPQNSVMVAMITSRSFLCRLSESCLSWRDSIFAHPFISHFTLAFLHLPRIVLSFSAYTKLPFHLSSPLWSSICMPVVWNSYDTS